MRRAFAGDSLSEFEKQCLRCCAQSSSGRFADRSRSTLRHRQHAEENRRQLSTKTRAGKSNVSTAELDKFRRLRSDWWNPSSKTGAGPLHAMNVIRVQHIVRQVGHMLPAARERAGSVTPLKGVRALDVGCGGGVLSESLARLGADVTAIDPSEENITVAAAHAQGDPLTRDITYEATTVEALVDSQGGSFDLVASLEVIEHVEDPSSFVSALRSLTCPGGMLTISTINRTAKSFALAIVGAEYLAGLVPKGTHDWHKFVKPNDLKRMIVEGKSFAPDNVHTCGLIYNPLTGRWSEDWEDANVNYIVTAVRSQQEAL